MPALAAVLVVATLGAPALAEHRAPAPGRVAVAARVVQQTAALALAGHVDSEAVVGDLAVPLPEPVVMPQGSSLQAAEAVAAKSAPAAPTSRCALGSRCAYKALLGYLVITNDLEIPGAPGMALRLIPTKSALAGETSSPIVLKPRVVGTSWYGLDVAARF